MDVALAHGRPGNIDYPGDILGIVASCETCWILVGLIQETATYQVICDGSVVLDAGVVRVILKAPVDRVPASHSHRALSDMVRLIDMMGLKRMHIHGFRYASVLDLLWVIVGRDELFVSFDPVSPHDTASQMSRVKLHDAVVYLYRVEEGVVDLVALTHH